MRIARSLLGFLLAAALASPLTAQPAPESASPSRPDSGYTAPGWYRLFLGDRELVVRISGSDGDHYDVEFQGKHVRIHRSRVERIEGIASPESTLSPEVEALCRDAIGQLASTDAATVARASAALGEAFPGARGVVHEALSHRLAAVRRGAVKLLGEKGSFEEDADAIAGRLSDPDQTVRLLAVFALRALGPESMDHLFTALKLETEARVRKGIVRSLQQWGGRDAVVRLIDAMQRESDRSVRKFIRRALTSLLGTDVGRDPVAWKKYHDRLSGQTASETDERVRMISEEP